MKKKPKKITIEAAIKYLVEHSVYSNEWQGAGMWEAVVSLIEREKAGKRITESWLKLKLEEAENR